MNEAIVVIYVPEKYSEQLDRLAIDYTLFYYDEDGNAKPVDVESRCPLKLISKDILGENENEK